jgi:hypothetical protein
LVFIKEENLIVHFFQPLSMQEPDEPFFSCEPSARFHQP